MRGFRERDQYLGLKGPATQLCPCVEGALSLWPVKLSEPEIWKAQADGVPLPAVGRLNTFLYFCSCSHVDICVDI